MLAAAPQVCTPLVSWAIKFSSDSVMAGVKSGLRFIDLHKQFTHAFAVTSKCYMHMVGFGTS
jgi:hypothetical protein